MGITDLQVNMFKEYFDGNKHNYGEHIYRFNDSGEKEKGDNRTIKDKLLTIGAYKQHLLGKVGLGIIPINADNKCKFAVIDIDVYNQDFTPYLRAIKRYNFPVVPFYSKSKGYHLYIFFKHPVKAKEAIGRARAIARVLGISLFVKQHKNEALEIFPKQDKLAEGQRGSWINLPYFNGTDSHQVAIDGDKELGFDEAMSKIKDNLTSIEAIDELLEELPYGDAPPCLQTVHLLSNLTANNGRNNYLFSFGVYLKKKDENYFEQSLAEVNNALPEPIEVKRLEETVLSSIRKRDYSYKCTAAPICDFCDKKICQKRTYGIGKEGGFFTNLIFGDLLQYKTASPYYEWQVKGQDVAEFKTLRFKNEDEIIKQDMFLRLCMRELRFLPYKMKQTEWFKLVNQALLDIKLIDIDMADDTSPLVRFNNIFYEFLTGRALAANTDQILAKRVYFDAGKQKYYFRTKDFVEYLYDVKMFRAFSSTEVHALLSDAGVIRTRVYLSGGKQIRVVEIPQHAISEDFLISKSQYDVDFDAYTEEEDF